MADPYWRYMSSADRDIRLAGYIPSDASTLSSQSYLPSYADLSTSSILQRDITGPRPEPSSNGYPSSWEDRYLIGRRDVIHGTEPVISNIINDRPDSLRKDDGIPTGVHDSNVLFVDALPSDCSRREVSHLFRPFRGFKEIRLVHKEPRNGADKGMVLCFVEFTDSNHALTALEALQGYKFDNKKPDSPALRIHFARFPFQLPSDDTHIPSQASPDSARFPSQPPPSSAHFSSQLLPDSVVYSSKPPRDSAHFPSQPPRDSAHFPSQQPRDDASIPSLQPRDSTYISSQQPRDSAHFPSQQPRDSAYLPSQQSHDSAHFPSQQPLNSAHFPSQQPPNSAHFPFQLPPHREEQDLANPREKEPTTQDEEPVVMKKKKKRGSFKNKERVEDSDNQEKKFCIKCKQNHYGECYSFKNCYICGNPGHIGKDCTSAPRLCYGCGEPGHIHSLCPNGKKYVKMGKGSGTSEKKGIPPKT